MVVSSYWLAGGGEFAQAQRVFDHEGHTGPDEAIAATTEVREFVRLEAEHVADADQFRIDHITARLLLVRGRGRRSAVQDAVKQIGDDRDRVEVAFIDRDVQVDLVLGRILRDHVGLGRTRRAGRTLEAGNRSLERGASVERVTTATTDLLEDRLEHIVEIALSE